MILTIVFASALYCLLGWIGLILALLTYLPVLTQESSLSPHSRQIIEQLQRRSEEVDRESELRLQSMQSEGHEVSHRLMQISYMDTLKTGSEWQKIALISLLSFHPGRNNIQLIRQALKDQNDGIRVIAATALQKMDQRFLENLEKLRLTGKPQDLAREILAYLQSGLADPIQSALLVEEVLAISRSQPKSLYMRSLLVNVLIIAGDLAAAELEAESVLRTYPDDIETLLNLLAISYKRRDLDKLLKRLEKTSFALIRKDKRLHEIYAYWNGYTV